jgi:hypothetical protein
MAAVEGTLPKDFDRWEIAYNGGWTVAHEAARLRNLPEDFKRWNLIDNRGRTVMDVHLEIDGWKDED